MVEVELSCLRSHATIIGGCCCTRSWNDDWCSKVSRSWFTCVCNADSPMAAGDQILCPSSLLGPSEHTNIKRLSECPQDPGMQVRERCNHAHNGCRPVPPQICRPLLGFTNAGDLLALGHGQHAHLRVGGKSGPDKSMRCSMWRTPPNDRACIPRK